MNWSALLTVTFLLQVIASGISLMVPLLLTALGENLAQKSGVLNLSLEGIMLFGGFMGFYTVYKTESALLGILVSMIAGGFLALIFAFVTITLRANQVVTALGILTLGTGLALFFYKIETSTSLLMPKIETLGKIPIPILSKIPFLGPILFNHDILTYTAFILTIIITIILKRTSFGLRITAVGEFPKAADTLGINVLSIRYLCVLAGGILAGLGGAYFTLVAFGMFGYSLISGRGFMAVAIVAFGRWKPYGIFFGALLFGIVDALQSRLQVLGFPVPVQFLLMLPYIAAIVVLILSKGVKPPASLAQPYSRE